MLTLGKPGLHLCIGCFGGFSCLFQLLLGGLALSKFSLQLSGDTLPFLLHLGMLRLKLLYNLLHFQRAFIC